METILGKTGQVSWLGQVPHSAMSDFYNSADILVSTSWREGYSFALAEALACGVSPVVSAIPASLAAIGPLGHHYAPGDEEGLVQALLKEPTPRGWVSAHFERFLSYPAMARRSIEAYKAAAVRAASRRGPRRDR
jgi:glycosyltransferase involved in cell wall biosynthesis